MGSGFSVRPRSHSSSVQGKRLRLCLCGGGTGGHVYPALTVAEALLEAGTGQQSPLAAELDNGQWQPHNEPNSAAAGPTGANDQPHVRETNTERALDLVYIGSTEGMERAIVERESNLPFLGLPAAAIRGRNPITLTHNSVTIAAGALAARGLLRQLRPAALLGTGGYVCVPVFLAARSLGIPSIIYLPDVVPGMAVWMLARVATQVACTTITSRPHLEQPVGRLDVVETGYPVRKGLFDQDRASCRAAFGIDDDLPVLLVYGGSRGARSINQAIKALLPDLLPLCRIIHVCGREGDEDWLHEAAAALDAPLQARYQLYPYLESGHPLGDRVDQPERTMVRALVAADIAVCRSGASILAELPAAGLASVLVPYPYVHQDENADYLVEHGAAVKVADHAMLPSDGSPRDGSLFAAIHHLIIHKTERQHMTERSRALARPDAAERLANALLALARRNEGW